MILVIDVGNTNIVVGVYDAEKLLFVSRFSSKKGSTADEYAVFIKTTLEIRGVNVSQIEGAIVSSVVPQETLLLSKGINLAIGKEPMIVGPGIKTGMNIKIDNPAQLGSDILVDSVACSVLYEKPCIIIDMGTATSITVLTKKNEITGGALMPGVGISLDALSQRAAQLPGIAFVAPPKAIGTNTVDCMESGIVLGQASMIDGMVERFEQEMGEKCTIVATGGYSKEICEHTKCRVIYDDTLLLKGLKILWDKNTMKKEAVK